MSEISKIYRHRAQKRLLESAKVKKKVADECLESILEAAQLIVDTFKLGGKVMICGNGGSAADSQHMAAEFVCILNKSFERPALPAIALTTNTSILTAHANDLGFDKIFKRQVEALGTSDDLLIGISTSGNSSNVIGAIKAATSAKIKTIALMGASGKLTKMADIVIKVPSTNTQYIQESHLAIEHLLCEIVEDYIFAKKKDK